MAPAGRALKSLAATLAWLGVGLAAAEASAQAGLTLDSVEAYATIHSASVVAGYTGDDDGDAVARVEYRRAGEAAFKTGHALVRLAGKRFAGSVLELEPDRGYELRVVAVDPDNPAPVALAASLTTRRDAPEPPTGGHYHVSVTGSDAGPGSLEAPFATIQAGADAAGPGDTVHVLPGVYHEQVRPPRGGLPGAPIRFVAEGAGVVLDGSDQAIAAGAVWTHAGGAAYWTPFAGESRYLAIDGERIYDYQSLDNLLAENGNIGLPGVIQGGFYVAAAAGRLHLIAPDHGDPSGRDVRVAVRDSAFLLDGLQHVVIEGFELRYYGSAEYSGVGVDLRDSSRCWVRDNTIHNMNTAVRVRRSLASENVIEHNFFWDTGVYDWPWESVKSHTPEASAVSISSGFGNIVRRNTLAGSFNGVATGDFDDPSEELARDTDVYANVLRFHGDDGLEPEGAQRNVRYWSNVVRDVYNAVSIAPIRTGPLFLVRNLLWGYQEHALKLNNATSGWVFIYHTTAVPLAGTSFPGAQAMSPSLPFGGVTSRNNIWQANRYVIEYSDGVLAGAVDLDLDALFTSDFEAAGRFVKWLGVRYPDLAALEASATIERNGFELEPVYEDPTTGDFNLVAGHGLIDAGVLIEGINADFVVGAAPDVGAFERGGTGPHGDGGGELLLRNSQWPGAALADIFTGPAPGCPPPLETGCPAGAGTSLDPYGADCEAVSGPDDDDTHVVGPACRRSDPDPSVLGDGSRPLVFYQVDREPGVCGGLRLVKDGVGGIWIGCP